MIAPRPKRPVRGTETLYAIGHRFLEGERTTDAETIFRLTLRERPKDERGWLGLGLCHERAGYLRTALELYSLGAVIAQPSPLLHLARARVLRLVEDEDAAQHAFDEAINCAHPNQDDLVGLATHERARL